MKTLKRRASDRSFSGPLCIRIKHARKVAHLSQGGLAKALHVGPSAVAQWEVPDGTSPTIEHLIQLAIHTGISFEWLATGRGDPSAAHSSAPALDFSSIACDELEDRLLVAYRRIPSRRRQAFVRWMEDFF